LDYLWFLEFDLDDEIPNHRALVNKVVFEGHFILNPQSGLETSH
jgi:hypothetical protein